MAITDAMGKCFAAIGLAADVYMGQHSKTIDYASDEEINALSERIADYNADESRLLKYFGVASVKELTSSEMNQAFQMLESKYGGSDATN